MRALILAAGEGRRMQPVTLTTPKPLVEVAGTPMAVRQILALRKAGVEEIVLNVAHLGDRIVETLGDGSAWGVRLRYSVDKIADSTRKLFIFSECNPRTVLLKATFDLTIPEQNSLSLNPSLISNIGPLYTFLFPNLLKTFIVGNSVMLFLP